jgi:hypothetical protein
MPTTTNYGWTTPADTDLVKDGAAAIRTLGSSIDTTVFNNASAGIPKTIVDAKGDLIAATASDTVSRLAVGTDGQVLLADSTAATGLAWGSPASGGMTQIASGNLSGVGTVTVSSISSTYINLLFVLRNPQQATGQTINLRFNGVTSAVYGWEKTNGGGTSGGLSGQSSVYFTDAASGDAKDTHTINVYDIQNSVSAKSGSVLSSQNQNGSGFAQTTNWNFNSTSAITSLTVFLGSGTFSGGSYVLYGVK